MEHPAYTKLVEMASTPEAMEATVEYLVDKFFFIKPKDAVLICFTRNQPNEIGSLFGEAVKRRGGEPVYWEKDFRWKTMLRQAFSNRVNAVIGPPMVVLGLSKIARFNGTPLYIRNVVTAGYPCMRWMVEGLAKGFDCDVQGIFTPGGRLISGFVYRNHRDAHLREDLYGVEIANADEEGVGDMILYSKQDTTVRYPTGEKAKIETENCGCPDTSLYLTHMQPGSASDLELDAITQNLISWTSVLDCRVRRSGYGLELELIVFPGEKLPKLPSAARQVIRAWNPDKDEPIYYTPGIEKN